MILHNRRGVKWLITGILCGVLLPEDARATPGEKLWGENLAHNSSFEEGADTQTGWVKRRAYSVARNAVHATMRIDREVAHTGKQSLNLSGDADTTSWFSIESSPMTVKPGENYKVEGWIKTKDINPVRGQPLHCNLHIRFSNATGVSVPVGSSRVVVTPIIKGSQDWTRVERVVTAPPGAANARVGCVLTCAGTVWFDDVTFHKQLEISWRKTDTDRITFLYEGDDAPSQEKVASTTEHLAAIESALGVKHQGKIRFYSYDSVERKREITGNPADAHYSAGAVHTVGWDDRHKLAHLVLMLLGDSTLLMREGLAVYLSQENLGVDLHQYVSRMSREQALPSIAKLVDDARFRELGVDHTFPLAGSFLRHLVEEYGMDKVKELYFVTEPGELPMKFEGKFRQIIGREIEDVEGIWRSLSSGG